MIKKLLMVFIVLISIQFYAQEGTASPYSYYGIGSLKFKGTVENRSMGGLSVYSDSIHINLRNPASYGGYNLNMYNQDSRPVTFSVGGSHTSTNLESDNAEGKVSTTTFDYVALSIPLKRLGIGFGLVPYSSVGYKLENYNEDGDLLNRYNGKGGVNKVYFSAGYQLTKSFSLGVDGHYNFGNTTNSNIALQYTNGEIVQYQTKRTNRSDLSGFSLNFGALFKTNITEKLQLISSLTYAPESKLKSRNQQSLSTLTINSITGAENIINTIDTDLAAQGLDETELIIPSKISIGAGLGESKKWFAGVEYTSIKTSNFYNELYDSDGRDYQDGSIFSVGGFYIPEYNSFTSYWKRIVYRAGMHFENTGLNINDQTINDFGISFGLGLPLGNGISNANIGFEYGKKGTTQNNLVKENYFNLMISLSLNDRWFNQRKYD